MQFSEEGRLYGKHASKAEHGGGISFPHSLVRTYSIAAEWSRRELLEKWHICLIHYTEIIQGSVNLHKKTTRDI